MTAEQELPEIPAIPTRVAPAPITVLQTAKAQEIEALIQSGASIERDVPANPPPPRIETPKPTQPSKPRGRPPGSKNKPKENATPPPVKSIPSATNPAESIAKKAIADEAKARDKKEPPDFTEWQSFIGEVVLHWFSVAFVAFAFRGVPYREVMSQADWEDIQLDDDELNAAARPFAHMMTHSSLNNKYGRVIMNSRDSIEAIVIMAMWGQRTMRISRKYRQGYHQWIAEQEASNVARIDRPDRVRDNPDENPTAEAAQPIAVGSLRPAWGHGFN